MKTIIIDSGGTTADWAILEDKTVKEVFSTEGLHPSKDALGTIVESIIDQHLVSLDVNRIYIYGSGATTQRLKDNIRIAFTSKFPDSIIEVESDLLGAARALCGNNEGIVCILGTGSNSAYYNGQTLTRGVPSGGYLLGDEGSGFHLSKTLIIKYLRKELSIEATKAIDRHFKDNQIDILSDIYTSKIPNAFIASLSVLLQLLNEEDRNRCIIPCFEEFIEKRVVPLHDDDIGIFFTGSIAFHYRKELLKALNSFNLQAVKLEPKPIEALIEYHKENL